MDGGCLCGQPPRKRWWWLEYKVDKLYRAVVNSKTGDGVHRIFFKFHDDYNGRMVCIAETRQAKPITYYIDEKCTYVVRHKCKDGIWAFTFSVDCNPVVSFLTKDGLYYTPTISDADLAMDSGRQWEGKHYDAIIEDDMVDAWKYGIDYRKGGDSMTKQLYHVILFNKVTETIDYKAYLPAQDQTDAVMIAAQNHGKYNSNIHIVITKHIAEYDKKG